MRSSTGVYTVPGDGCVDFEAALTPVAEAGYWAG